MDWEAIYIINWGKQMDFVDIFQKYILKEKLFIYNVEIIIVVH